MRGRVIAVRGRSVTVQFDDPVDWNRLPAAGGELEVTVSSVVYRKQRDAVALLRDGLSRNPTLLSVLVDRRPAPIRPTTATPTIELDLPQRAAFDGALGRTDLLVINGPPGTGKTRVISQVANATAMEMEMGRVLITAHSNRAVDNVLTVLPKELTVIRVGGGKVTEDGQPYLLENRARELRDRVLGTVHTTVERYGDLDLAARWAEVLASQTSELGTALDHHAARHADWSRERRAAGGAAAQAVDRLAKMTLKLTRKLGRIEKSLLRNEKYARRFAFLAGWFAAHRRRLEGNASAVRAALTTNAHDTAAAELRLDEFTKVIPAVAKARQQLDQATILVDKARSKALPSAVETVAAVGVDEQAPVVHDTRSATEVHAELMMLSTWASAQVPLLRRRAALLREWHTAVSDADTQLYPELIRYADVVAATSIGSASRSELSDVDFDLAIVDEAGQIGIADVLVPLVRAQRAVLVGDRMQLPPFLNAEVEKWGGKTGDDAIPYLLTHSALEMLADELPATHVKWLTEQRRMPEVIGTFISTAFYEDRLTTRVDRQRTDDVFGSPFAFVDTSTLPNRWEQPASAVERGGTGYLNHVEAELLARLAAHYDRCGEDWAVILPYQAQVKQVRKRLRTLLGDKEIIDLNVATVDSFQGGERTVVLYGFTRSNQANKVGFLDELRRANVAFTRAKEQLVLVGDLEMLANATDRQFRELVRALRAYVGSKGEISDYPDVMDRIDRLETDV